MVWLVFADYESPVPAARQPLVGSVRRNYGGQEEGKEGGKEKGN